MNRTAKIVISAIGLAAVIVPAVLLIIFSAKGQAQPNVSNSTRQIDQGKVDEIVSKHPPIILVSPKPASSSASPLLPSSPSAR